MRARIHVEQQLGPLGTTDDAERQVRSELAHGRAAEGHSAILSI